MRDLSRYPMTDAEAIEVLTALRDSILAADEKAGACGNIQPIAIRHMLSRHQELTALKEEREHEIYWARFGAD